MNQQKSNVEYKQMEPEERYLYGTMRESFSLIDIRLPPPKGPSAVEWCRFLTSACCAIALLKGAHYLFAHFVVFVLTGQLPSK
jgi:hypothetical protein